MRIILQTLMSAWVHDWLSCKEAKTKSIIDILVYICSTSVLTNSWLDWLGLFCSEDLKHSYGMRSGLCFLRALGKADDIWKTPNGCLKSRNWNEIKSDQYWNSKGKSVRQWIRQNTSWQTDLTAIGIGNHLCWIDTEAAK